MHKVLACCILHNYAIDHEHDRGVFFDAEDPDPLDNDDRPDGVFAEDAYEKRDQIAAFLLNTLGPR